MSEYYVKDITKFNFFASIDEDNKVVQVIALEKSKCNDLFFPESESVGQSFIESLGLQGKWLQTSYTGEFRSAYATPGADYDVTNDRFIPSCPFPSWKYNKEKNVWVAPIPKPDDINHYFWDEATQQWYEDYEVE